MYLAPAINNLVRVAPALIILWRRYWYNADIGVSNPEPSAQIELLIYSERTYFFSDSYLQYSRVPVSHADPNINFSCVNSMR